MSPYRALMAARLQVLWNLAHRGQGLLGTVAAVVITVIAVACLIPPFWMFFTFGQVLGQDLPATQSPALTWLCGLQALLVFGLGGMAGLRHRAGFERELLRLFPMKPAQILVAELPFNLIDTIAVLGFTMFLGLGLGLGRALPGNWVHVLLIVIQGMLGLLLFQQLIGASRRLVSGSRLLAMLTTLVVILAASYLSLGTSRSGIDALMALVSWLPTSAGYLALQAAARGNTGPALLLQIIGLAFTAALFVLSAWLQLKELEQDPPLKLERRSAEKLWSFRHHSAGIARLFVSQVTGARAGRLALLLPLFSTFMFVLAADIVRRSAAGRDPTGFHLTVQSLFEKIAALPHFLIVPVAVILFNRDIWMNQFSWHGSGIKSLLLAPLRTADILRGTLLGLLLLQIPQALVASMPFLRLRMPGMWEVLTGLAAALMAACCLGTLGHVLSARCPRVLGEQGERGGGIPAWLNLVSTGAVLILAGLLLGISRGLAPLAIWAPALACLLLAGLVLLLHARLMERLCAQVDASRELLAETLG